MAVNPLIELRDVNKYFGELHVLRDIDLKALAKVRAEAGMVFQSSNLLGHRAVLQNASPAQVEARGRERGEADRRSLELPGRVGPIPRARKYPAQLSGGRRQRVAIARALTTDPGVPLFDEPTSALGPEIVDEVLEVLEIMRQLARDGMTTVVVTHGMGFARSAARRAVFTADGTDGTDGADGADGEDRTPEAFFTDPRSDHAKDFLSKTLTH
ncbi:ATP-binding cassette domain-containing protein [Streptomyces beigongshangae]|uniref:ATP-binding cassette domain-containing protein n=1 Tax=Streptomyces beigongshangae TaxID=2841597 RepID=UPI001C865FE0|nr:ATP-binding cassette domain-containing protein [Streptomyces sp. REN17]